MHARLLVRGCANGRKNQLVYVVQMLHQDALFRSFTNVTGTTCFDFWSRANISYVLKYFLFNENVVCCLDLCFLSVIASIKAC